MNNNQWYSIIYFIKIIFLKNTNHLIEREIKERKSNFKNTNYI